MGKEVKTSIISFRVDEKLKKDADELFKNLGLNTSVVLNSFLTQCVRDQEIPYTPSMKSREPSDELKEALQEVEDYENGKIELKGYHDINEFIEDALKWKVLKMLNTK